MDWINTVVHLLHLSAAIVWIGGMIFTSFLLGPVLRANLGPEARAPLVRALGQRFQMVEAVCVAVLVTTGIYKLTYMGPPILRFFEDRYGQVLFVKLLIVAAMLFLSFLHSVIWGPRLGEMPQDSAEAGRLRQRIVFWARINLGLGFMVVACAAMLRAYPF